ncbi:MAG: flagellar hook-length control protein FliK [Pseudomonadota bacterium]
MHAMNLSASLLPSRPDGPTQATATAAEDANLIALFEDALGPMLPIDQQTLQPARTIPADVAEQLVSLQPLTDSPVAVPHLSTAEGLQTGFTFAATPTGETVRLTAASSTSLPPVVTHTVEHKPMSAAALSAPTALPNPQTNSDAQPSLTRPHALQISPDDAALSVDVRSGEAPKQTSQTWPLPIQQQSAFPLTKFPTPGTALTPAPLKPDSAKAPLAAAATDILAAPVAMSSDTAVQTGGAAVVRTISPSHTPLEPEAMAQIRDTIRAGTRTGTIEVQLDPPELGRVLIELEVGRQGQVKAVISASESDTLDLMRRHGETLAGDLKDSGFDDVELDWQQSEQSTSDDDGPRTVWQVNEAVAMADINASTRRHDGALDIQI